MLFNPNLLGEKRWWSFFYNYKSDYLEGSTIVDDDRRVLAKEWASYAGANNEDAFSAIFGEVPDSLKHQNTFIGKVESSKELTDFFALAKAGDSLAAFPDAWHDDEVVEQRRSSQRIDLLSRLEKQVSIENDPFLKKKYAYQFLKIAFYADARSAFLKTFNDYFKRDTSVLHWWATHYKAVILGRQGEADSANYLHARVFSNSPSKMFASKQHFSRRNLDATLALATSNEERADVLMLAAVINPGRVKALIEEIHGLDPDHPNLPLLIAREINKIEDWLGTTKYCHEPVMTREWNNDYLENWQSDFQYALEFRKFIRQLTRDLGNRNFLNLASAYLALLTNDANEATTILKGIDASDEQTLFQINILKLLAVVQSGDIKTNETQEQVGVLYEKLLQTRVGMFESQRMLYALSSYLREVFEQADLRHLAGLFDNYATNKFCYTCEFNTFEYSLIRYFDKKASAKDIKKLLEVYDKSQKNALERVLLLPYAHKYFFYDVLSVIELRNGNVQEAASALRQIPNEFWIKYQNAISNLTRDPFKDVSEQVSPGSIHTYNKTEIVNRMLQLEQSATDSKQRADSLFELANAWYNFSDHSWFMISYGYTLGETSNPRHGQVARLRARKYYTLALQASTSREQTAKITYMLALLSDDPQKLRYARQFESMKDTQFYGRRNCLTTRDLAQ